MTEPEEKNPWLRLARLSEDFGENKRLWNGYQKYLLKPYEKDYQRQMGNPKFAEIEDCKFNEGSSFHSATFGLAIFRSASFEDQGDFAQAKFTSGVCFEDARFSSSVCFDAAEFHNHAEFNVAATSVPAVPLYFNGAKFINHPAYFLAARCTKIQIGQMLNGRAPSNP